MKFFTGDDFRVLCASNQAMTDSFVDFCKRYSTCHQCPLGIKDCHNRADFYRKDEKLSIISGVLVVLWDEEEWYVDKK